MNTKKVMIIDDNRDMVEILLRYLKLKKPSLETRCVFDGQVAFREIKQFQPQLVILDINLPGISGFEIVECIRSEYSLNTIKIMIVSGSDLPFSEKNGILKKTDAFMIKPFSMKDMIPKISHLLSSSETLYTVNNKGEKC